MRAWLMDSYDGVEKLRLGEVPDPQPGPGQVLLRVRFAALNPADAFLAQAMYPAKPALPHILGRDGVGDVLAVGRRRERRARRRHGRRAAWPHRRGSLGHAGREGRGVLPPTSFRFRKAGRWKKLAGGPVGVPDRLAGPDAMERSAGPAARRFGAAGDRRLGRRRHGCRSAGQIDESDRGGFVPQRRKGSEVEGARGRLRVQPGRAEPAQSRAGGDRSARESISRWTPSPERFSIK